MLGNAGAWLSVWGSVQSGSIGVAVVVAVVVVVELGGGDVFIEEDEQLKEQLVPRRRDKISMRQTTRYFIFTLFITYLIIVCGQN